MIARIPTCPDSLALLRQLTLPDGSSSSIYTTSPRSNIAISKDTSNHPLWGFPSATGTGGPVEDEGGRMGRFARRFANNNEQSSVPAEQSGEGAAASSSPAKAAVAGETGAEDSTAVKKEATKSKEKDTQVKAEESSPSSEAFDLFDLSLEGEEVEVTGHKVVEESAKKGKKGSGKKK